MIKGIHAPVSIRFAQDPSWNRAERRCESLPSNICSRTLSPHAIPREMEDLPSA